MRRGRWGNNMLSAVEAILDPAMLTLSLWLVSAGIEGQPLPPYLILGVIVFSITFPGASRLQFTLSITCAIGPCASICTSS